MNNAPEWILSARSTGADTHVELRTWLSWPEVIGPVIDRCAQSKAS
jgi:hypothetical protein